MKRSGGGRWWTELQNSSGATSSGCASMTWKVRERERDAEKICYISGPAVGALEWLQIEIRIETNQRNVHEVCYNPVFFKE